MSTRHKHPKGCFVLRADVIRPYGPMGKLLSFNELFCCVSRRALSGGTAANK